MMQSPRIIKVMASAIAVMASSTVTTASTIHQQEEKVNSDVDELDSNNPHLRAHVPVLNNSPVPLEIVWHSVDETLTTRDGVAPGGTFYLHTYVGEQFDIYEVPTRNGRCREAPRDDPPPPNNSDNSDDTYDYDHCWQTSFIISNGQKIEVVVDEDFEASVTDEILLAQEYAAEALEDCDDDEDDSQAVLECWQEQMTASLEDWNSEWDYHHAALQRMGALLEPYVCSSAADNYVAQETSPSLKEYEWESTPASDKETKTTHKVKVLHQRPSSQIHVLQNFITLEECQAVEAIAEPRLQRATVLVNNINENEGPVPSKRSQERQAWQASIDMNDFVLVQDQNDPIQPLLALRERMYSYASHALNITLSHEGQERLESIQYFGPEQPPRSADNSEEALPLLLDQYESHCDGPCHGDPHQAPDRIATLIMYCEVPTVGGHTHFRNAGVHVAPTVGSAVFFSYVHPAGESGMETDVGLTEHTGCPVYEGSKKIVTQWIRHGVSEERPWDSF